MRSQWAHSYNFWRNAGTTCLAVRLRWDDPPLCGFVNATWSILADKITGRLLNDTYAQIRTNNTGHVIATATSPPALASDPHPPPRGRRREQGRVRRRWPLRRVRRGWAGPSACWLSNRGRTGARLSVRQGRSRVRGGCSRASVPQTALWRGWSRKDRGVRREVRSEGADGRGTPDLARPSPSARRREVGKERTGSDVDSPAARRGSLEHLGDAPLGFAFRCDVPRGNDRSEEVLGGEVHKRASGWGTRCEEGLAHGQR